MYFRNPSRCSEDIWPWLEKKKDIIDYKKHQLFPFHPSFLIPPSSLFDSLPGNSFDVKKKTSSSFHL